MTQQDFIDEITKRLIPAYQPLEIYLYGDKEWGVAEDPEDIELTVVVQSSEHQRHIDRVMAGYTALRGLGLGKQLFVFTQDEFNEKAQSQLSAAYYAKKYGVKIYART